MVDQQEVSMSLPTDPAFSFLQFQWHLHNPDANLLDLNVLKVWNPGEGPAHTGAGVRVVVIDDGFDYFHVDLFPNYNVTTDWDFAEADSDPFGSSFGCSPDNHGTSVAGIIGADNNGIGTVGVAFDSTLIGFRAFASITDFFLQNVREAVTASVTAHSDVVNISLGILWRFDE